LQNKINRQFKPPQQDMEKSNLEEEIKEEIAKLLNLSEEYLGGDVGVAEMERGILSQLLRIGLALLKSIIIQKLGKLDSYEVTNKSYKNTGGKSRRYLSLFGILEINRPSHWSKELGQFHKLDEYLNLPIGNYWSYNIQKIVGSNSSETDFRERVFE
jgi:hypothetical protein